MRLLDYEQAAEALRLSSSSLRKRDFRARAAIPVVKVAGVVRFDADAIAEYLKARSCVEESREESAAPVR
jgi:hypothetical protein